MTTKEPPCKCLHCGREYHMTPEHRIAHTCLACFKDNHWIIISSRSQCPKCKELGQLESKITNEESNNHGC